jgi:hypothetical protein
MRKRIVARQYILAKTLRMCAGPLALLQKQPPRSGELYKLH